MTESFDGDNTYLSRYCHETKMNKSNVGNTLRRRRKRGFHSEIILVKKLKKHGYKAVRIPVSNPSRNPLPDIIARRNGHVYAFEVKTAEYYAYFPKKQTNKLFGFLNQFFPIPHQFKHAVLAARLGKRWVFRELDWMDWRKGTLPEKARIMKRDRGNFDLKSRRRR